jgi:Holliday junction resolvase RusA-like endonuclease
VVLHIPEVPVAKARPRVTGYRGRPHAYTPLSTARAEQRIRQHARRQLGEAWSPLTGPLAISVTVLRAVPKELPRRLRGVAVPDTRPDLSNYLKLIEDALTLGPDGWGVVRDDAQFIAITARKLYAVGREPGWEVVIEPFRLEVPQ